jgi:peroxisomal 3,2-trans-enoyl-CoA isomerase
MEWINEQPHILITVLTGSGRYFSAGADVSDAARILPEEITSRAETDPLHITTKRQFYAQRAHMNNRRLGQTFYHHDKILVAAMNGPVVGISSAFISYCDFIYCFDDFFLLTPFSSLALVAEGGSSTTFIKKVGNLHRDYNTSI